MAQVGFRIRGIEPPELARQPDSVRLMFWAWVVELGLRAKDKELAAGLDKDGEPLRPLKVESIKHRKSEVGPTFKSAPPLEPSYGRSRVRSLLTGRAHSSSAEFFWRFDPITRRSFADVLIGQRDRYGRDVFGLSPKGTAWVATEAAKKWEKWKDRASVTTSPVTAPGRQTAGMKNQAQPVRMIAPRGITDLRRLDLGADAGAGAARTQRAIDAGLHTGFRRLNARGEKWTPGPGVPEKLPVARYSPGLRHSVERALAVPFRLAPRAAARRESVVLVDVAKLEDAWARSPGKWIGPGGTAAGEPAKYSRFERWLLESRARGRAIAMPEVMLQEDRVVIKDGAHRFAVFRDQGAVVIPVSVPRDQAVQFRRRFGATLALLKAVIGAISR